MSPCGGMATNIFLVAYPRIVLLELKTNVDLQTFINYALVFVNGLAVGSCATAIYLWVQLTNGTRTMRTFDTTEETHD